MDLLLLAVVFWIIPLFVTRAQGKPKKRDGVWYGIFLGWLGVLVLAVLPPLALSDAERLARARRPKPR